MPTAAGKSCDGTEKHQRCGGWLGDCHHRGQIGAVFQCVDIGNGARGADAPDLNEVAAGKLQRAAGCDRGATDPGGHVASIEVAFGETCGFERKVLAHSIQRWCLCLECPLTGPCRHW